MRFHHLLLPLLGVAMGTIPVLAQPSPPEASSPQAAAGGWITQLQSNQWPTSKLEGLDVYSSNNGDKIGTIRDLILDSSGQLQAVVIGVGGYLGLGERGIAVPFDQINFVNEPRAHMSGATGEARLAGTSPGGGTVASPTAAGTAAVPAGSAAAASSAAATSNAPIPATPDSAGTGQAARATSGSAPNHAILMMSITKDELRAVPELRDAR